MSGFLKFLSASLLTVAVIGGAAAYFSTSWSAPPAHQTGYGYVIEQSGPPTPVHNVKVAETGRAS